MKYKKKNARTYHEHKGYYFSPLVFPHGNPQLLMPAQWAAFGEDDGDFLQGIVHPFSAAPEDDE